MGKQSGVIFTNKKGPDAFFDMATATTKDAGSEVPFEVSWIIGGGGGDDDDGKKNELCSSTWSDVLDSLSTMDSNFFRAGTHQHRRSLESVRVARMRRPTPAP